MNLIDNGLRAWTSFINNTLGINTEQPARIINQATQGFKNAITNVQLQPVKQRFSDIISSSTLAKAGQDFRRQAIDSIKPQALSILAGALVGGTAATVYNINKDLRAKKKKVQDHPQVRYTTKLSRVYGGMSLGVLAALLMNKYLIK